MGRFGQGRFRAEDLVLCLDPIYRWSCAECYAKLVLEKDDPRVGSGMCPKCDRCGAFMVPVPANLVDDPSN